MQQLNSGVYQIKNLVNGKIYIGSSTNLVNRFKVHLYDLKLNKHHSQILQRAWNKYGQDNFLFTIIAKCPPEYCIKLEQWFLDNLKPKYNICKTAGSVLGIKRSPETLKKMSDCKKGNTTWFGRKHSEKSKLLLSSKLVGKKKSREHIEKIRAAILIPVVQYGLDGNFLKEHVGIINAARETGIHSVCISACCKKKLKISGGYIWRYKNESLCEGGQYVNLFLFENHFCKLKIKKKISKTRLAKGFKLTPEHSMKISNALKKKYKDMDKNSPEYLNLLERLRKNRSLLKDSPKLMEQLKRIHLSNRKKVAQFDKKDNLIKIWASIKEAAEGVGLKANSLSNVIGKVNKKGRPLTSANYIWKFVDT